MSYAALANHALARPRLVGFVLLLVVAIAAFVGLPPKIEPNLLALLPPDEPSALALRELHETEGGVNLLTLSFQAENPETLKPFLSDVASQIETSKRVEFALHELDRSLTTQLALMQLEPDEIDELAVRMKGALALGGAMNPMVAQTLLSMGPLTERIQSATSDSSFLPGIASDEGKIIVRPNGSSHDQKFSVALMDEVDGILSTALAANPSVHLKWMGGAYRHNVEDTRGIKTDLAWTSGVSASLVLLVITYAFRSFRIAAIVAIPLLSANIITLGLTIGVLGRINTYTSFGSAILIGLGIDFAVHLIARVRELRGNGLEPKDAVVTAWKRVGPPCATAALTSAAGFLALSAADFRGFSELGTVLAVGLGVNLLVMLVVLPPLLVRFDRPDSSALRSFGSTRVVESRSSYRMAPGLLAAIVLLTGFAGATHLPKLHWEYDVSNLRRQGMAYAELSEAERSLARESYSPVVLRFTDDHTRDGKQREIDRRIENGDVPHVRQALSIATVLPHDQQARLESLRELQQLVEHPNFIHLPPPFVERMSSLKGVALQTITRHDLPAPVRTLLGDDRPEEHRLLVFPQGNMWDLREASAFETEIHDVLREPDAAGEYVALGALYKTMQRDLPIIGGLALLMVAVLTTLDLKRPHWIAAALGTLFAGMVWSGVTLQATGVSFTMVNVVGVPILLGIGVDVVIHLLHRLAEEGPGGVRRALRTTGAAATISTLTTILSFLSLTQAGNRGVRSLGLLVVIGLFAVFRSEHRLVTDRVGGRLEGHRSCARGY